MVIGEVVVYFFRLADPEVSVQISNLVEGVGESDIRCVIISVVSFVVIVCR